MAEICVQGGKKGFIAVLVLACVPVGLAGRVAAGPIVLFNTTKGSFEVELFPAAAPQSVANFLSYVNSGAYNNTFIHRVVDQTGFQIVQGGGYGATSAPFIPQTASIPHIATNPAIPLEYNLPNAIGTISMARTSAPNSATSEFFLNVSDNTTNLGPSNGGGYAVFGQILGGGLDVVKAINELPNLIELTGGGFSSSILGPIPLKNFTLQQTQITTSNLVVITSAAVVVPEPSTIALASLGGVALVVLAGRRSVRRKR